jgi:hypothetical protein
MQVYGQSGLFTPKEEALDIQWTGGQVEPIADVDESVYEVHSFTGIVIAHIFKSSLKCYSDCIAVSFHSLSLSLSLIKCPTHL